MYVKFPKLNEGELTKLRATVVCEDSLYQVAKKHNISEYIRVGHSERAHGGNLKTTILADSIEAIIAAIFFDGGIEEADKFIIDNLEEAMVYKIIKESGPDHDKTFTAEVILNGKVLANGTGRSKKLAEMQAAKKALKE